MEQFFQNPFLGVLNMSITGSYVILFVIAVRLLLKKAPKIYSYSLWGVAFFRLLVPFSFVSAFSFLGFFRSSTGTMTHIPADIGTAVNPQVDLGSAPINDAVTASLPPPTPYASVNPLQVTIAMYSVVWILGMAALLLYSIFTYRMLKRRIAAAVLTEGNVYECEAIDSPCVIGLIRPKIYLPYGLSPSERNYILKHEQTHIARFDYLIKPLAFLALCIHWFNPLVWAGFLMMGRDMEMSCDESVLKSMGPDIKKDYSSSLLSFAAGRRIIGGSPLAFGEGNTENRIRNVLNYRRLPMWIAVGILLALAVVGFGLLSNPEGGQPPADSPNKTQFTEQEMRSLAETWAESLKTRDGEPRYNIMSEKMKEQFIEGQKQRSDPWNFNIGVSSPWVTDYEITIKDGSAEILYHMTDSTQTIYDQKEIIYFGKENGKTVVDKSEELLSDFERYSYYAQTADEAMHAYSKALLESDYLTILALTPSSKLDPRGQLIWDTVKISDVNVTGSDVLHDQKACFQLELTIKDGGDSAFEKGVSPRWLWLVKGPQGWYAEGLMTGGPPDADWWNAEATSSDTTAAVLIPGTNDPFFGSNTEAAGTYGFDRLIYLSPVSSSTFDYAENRMKGVMFTIGTSLFQIDYPEGDDYTVKQPGYNVEMMTDEMVRAFEESTMNQVSISDYKEKYRYTIYTGDNQKTGFRLYVLDSELWLASYVDNTADESEITKEIWKLK